ncbi:4-alpha-glucanotransferase, partial [Scytonema sp. PCC 10023]
GYGNSPYAAYSAMAGNHMLISPELLQEQGLLGQEDFANLPAFNESQVDYEQVKSIKIPLLKKACQNFQLQATPFQQNEFVGFCRS